jgi:hypothetical protein
MEVPEITSYILVDPIVKYPQLGFILLLQYVDYVEIIAKIRDKRSIHSG